VKLPTGSNEKENGEDGSDMLKPNRHNRDRLIHLIYPTILEVMAGYEKIFHII